MPERHMKVRGYPVPKGSKRAFVTKNLQAVIVDQRHKELRAWESAVKLVCNAQWEGPPLEGPVQVELNFALLKPKSAPKNRLYPDKRPDLDKLVRAVLDGLKGVCYRDDGQVVELNATKEFDEEPGVSIIVRQTS